MDENIKEEYVKLVVRLADAGLLSPGPEKWNKARESREHMIMLALPVPEEIVTFLAEFEELVDNMTEGRGREAIETLLVDIFFQGLKTRAQG